jgi:hypothetical protein
MNAPRMICNPGGTGTLSLLIRRNNRSNQTAMKAVLLSILLISAVATISPMLCGEDFPQQDEIKRYEELTKSVELNGTIRSSVTANPGWYLLAMDGEDGKPFSLLLTPDTKFYEHYQPLEAEKGHAKIVVGQKVRLIHKPAFDEALHRMWASDVMYVKDWNEKAPQPTPVPKSHATQNSIDHNKALKALQNLVPNRGIQLTK